MKRFSVIILMIFSACTLLTVAEVLTLRFVGKDSHNNSRIELDSIAIDNQSKNWQQTITDTMFSLQLAENQQVDVRFGISQFAPNPFRGTAQFQLAVPTNSKVYFSITDLKGHIVIRQTEDLMAGFYAFRLTLQTSETFVLRATNGETTYIAKIINLEAAANNSLTLIGNIDAPKIDESATDERLFDLGDEMSYVGFATFENQVVESRPIAKSQTESEEIELIFDVCEPISNEFSESACGEYIWNGIVLDQSGNYTQTFEAENGCDSVVTLDLTINQPADTTIFATICAGEIYGENNFSENASGIFTQNLKTANGCDSIVTLNLVVLPEIRTKITETACVTFDWNGVVYTKSGEYAQTFTAENGCDSVVMLQLTINQPADTTIFATICAGEIYGENNFSENVSGMFTQNLKTANGCDSIVTLNLVVLPEIRTKIVETACETFDWNGVVYTKSGEYTQTFEAENGCDSVVTLDLTINQPADTTIFATICAGEIYGENNFSENASGIFTQNLKTANGCDSIVTLNLVVLPEIRTKIAETACETFDWNGVVYTKSGEYAQTFEAKNGCDSVVTLDLTINQPADTTIFATICAGEIYSENNFSENASGMFTQNLKTANGCDSIVTLNLVVLPEIRTKIVETACETFDWNGVVYTKSGEYTQTFEAENGCDSVVTLDLTIKPRKITYEFVDLDLPSGLLWATCNVGADKPEASGDYFAWGETIGKTEFTSENATYTGNTGILPLSADAANANIGEGRMPTIEEWYELYNYSDAQWTTLNDVYGMKFTSPYNGNSIFIPAGGGYRTEAGLENVGESGTYWSSELHSAALKYSDYIYINEDDFNDSYGAQHYGFSVRAVKEK